MSVGVIDAGVAVGWIHGRPRSLGRVERLFAGSRGGKLDLVMSVVNLAEVLRHTADVCRATGADAVALLRATGVRFHEPDEPVARRVAALRTSLGDAFAAATALELGARLHTTDGELVKALRGVRIVVTHY